MCVIRTGKEGETGLIEIQNVSYAYEDAAAKALNNVSLTINDGEFVAVVGHNGSGKSTLAKHLNALLLPTEGKVLVDGMDTADEADTLSIRQRVGMVFQNPDNQLVTTIVEEDVAFGPENIGVPGNEIRARVDRALAAVGMAGKWTWFLTIVFFGFSSGAQRAQYAFRRAEAKDSHCGHACHAAQGACAGRGHGHAGPQRAQGHNRPCDKAA